MKNRKPKATNGRTNGHPVKVEPQTQEDILRSISAEDWPKRREQILGPNVRHTMNTSPYYQLAHPVIVPAGRDEKGNQQISVHHGLRVRDRIAVDLLAASVSAKIIQPGIVAQTTAIPVDDTARRQMINLALQMANEMVEAMQAAEANDTQRVVKDIRDRMDSDWRAAHAPPANTTADAVALDPTPVEEDKPFKMRVVEP